MQNPNPISQGYEIQMASYFLMLILFYGLWSGTKEAS